MAVVAPYDEVAEDEEVRKPTRKAPPVPNNKVGRGGQESHRKVPPVLNNKVGQGGQEAH